MRSPPPESETGDEQRTGAPCAGFRGRGDYERYNLRVRTGVRCRLAKGLIICPTPIGAKGTLVGTEQAFCSDYGHHGRERCHVCGLPNPEAEQAFCAPRCRIGGGPAPCFDDLCHTGSETLCRIPVEWLQPPDDEWGEEYDEDDDG